MALLALILLLLTISRQSCGVEVERYTLSSFPNHERIAMHMPCKESNVFPTKCMCHIRCTDSACNNAAKLCGKYPGCKYMLLRGNDRNRFATLKREPTASEMSRFDVTAFLAKESKVKMKEKSQGPVIVRDLVESLGKDGEAVVRKMFQAANGTHCGGASNWKDPSARTSARSAFLSKGVTLVVLSFHSPRTLLNSMRSWEASGLLSWVAEKVAILNDPFPEEVAIAQAFGFKIVQPKDIPGAKMASPNVLTIGAAFYYALQIMTREYLLFLENDFKMDTEYPGAKLDLLAGLGMLEQGAEIVRLQSRTYQGCGNFLSCQQAAIHIQSGEKKRNWYSFYCPGTSSVENHVSTCLDHPAYRCFTSWDTNWSLNAALMKKSSMLSKKYALRANITKSIPEIGLAQFQQQDGLESVMVYSFPWAQWRVPICISLQGLFVHEEVETGS